MTKNTFFILTFLNGGASGGPTDGTAKKPASEETHWEKWSFNIGGLRLIERQREVPQYEQQ